jgi:endonuclease/exonuclease/phosphatase family metal-dependent hydrolase
MAVRHHRHRVFTGRLRRSLRTDRLNPCVPASDRAFSVVSLNLAKESDSTRIVDAISRVPRLRDADLFLFQEVMTGSPASSVAEEAARRLGYSAAFRAAAPNVSDQGLALVSRYSIEDVELMPLKACDLRIRGRNRFAMSATIQTPWGDVRVWNAHLDTRINAEERLEQLQPVIDEASRQSGPQLIGGDFNTNNLIWLGSIVPIPGGPSHGAAIRSAMKRHGFETPFLRKTNTYPAFRRHLDWIFVRELRSLAASVEPALFSDHNAIWARVRI